MSDIDVAFVTDSANLDYLSVAVTSLLQSAAAPERIVVHVLFDGDAAVAEARLAMLDRRGARLRVVTPDNVFRERGPHIHISPAAMLKVLLPSALPAVWRVVYLDTDVIVSRDIAELHATDLGGRALGGVAELGMYLRLRRGMVRRDNRMRDYFLALGLDPAQVQYINSGVLVMDLDRLRQLAFVERAIAEWTERWRQFITMDQCLINTVLRDEITLLDPRWNVLAHVHGDPRRQHYLPAMLRPALQLQRTEQWITHYTTARKPWNTAEVWHADLWWDWAQRAGLTATRPPAAGPTVAGLLRTAWLTVTAFASAMRSRRSKY